MIIAAAQIKSTRHDTNANIQSHLKWIEQAAQQNVQLILFPEMSLTGYERELAEAYSFSENDPRLIPFKTASVLHQMIIIVGAPIKIDDRLHIGSFVFLPDNTTTIYTKQFLHLGEEKFFSPSFNFNPVIDLGNEKISIAICADIANPQHSENAYKNKSTLYVASIFYTPNGITEAYEQLSDYAQQYSMNMLMANYAGVSYGLDSGGGSAFWNKVGVLIGTIEGAQEDLLIVESANDEWRLKKMI
jgi:predicted amidohydrolase